MCKKWQKENNHNNKKKGKRYSDTLVTPKYGNIGNRGCIRENENDKEKSLVDISNDEQDDQQNDQQQQERSIE